MHRQKLSAKIIKICGFAKRLPLRAPRTLFSPFFNSFPILCRPFSLHGKTSERAMEPLGAGNRSKRLSVGAMRSADTGSEAFEGV